MPQPKILCVVGPTACGKTKVGVLLARRYNGEVVSVDSMQIYRGMTIGTAAPTAEEMEGVPHHMIAVADPAEQWSAARYAQAAVPIVDDILRRGKQEKTPSVPQEREEPTKKGHGHLRDPCLRTGAEGGTRYSRHVCQDKVLVSFVN